LILEIILITIGIYQTQKIDPQQNGNSNDITERNSNSLINLARNLSILTDETKPMKEAKEDLTVTSKGK